MFVFCLFWIPNCICPMGSTPKGGPMENSPTTQATRHPRALSFFMFPVPPILLSCILHQVCTLPFLPVLYIYSNQISGLSLPCLPVVHIYLNPTKMNPSTLQTPIINCVSLLFLKQFPHQYNSKISPLQYPPCLPAPAPLTYNGGSLPLSFSMNQHQLC